MAPATTTMTHTLCRRRYDVRGQVQGVGFRPHVHRLACELGLAGHVLNRGDAVLIEAQGDADAIETFGRRLLDEKPPLARIDSLESTPIAAVEQDASFHIRLSEPTDAPASRIAIDTATCGDCARELLDARDRRNGYALINCTNCGPRYSIVRGVPYDRPNTTMTAFAMCDACAAEYHDPADRRFHAQPIACHDCGPTLSLATPNGETLPGDPIFGAGELLAAGKVLLVKGLGGFHLAVRADDEPAVSRLRALKQRDAKPFALMVRSIDEARELVELSDAAAELMRSPRCPIVLTVSKGNHTIAPSVAPGNHRLGVMLPYTPIHHLLFALQSPRLGPLVMTSANVSDEPLVKDNDEAVARLGGMCDAILWHDRPIERCVDDSVVIDMGEGEPIPVRRARGYVPEPIALPVACDEPGLCVGGELKNTVAVVRDGEAILSHHLGDLKHPLAFENFKQSIDDLCRLFDVRPKWIAHDLHPAYLSTQHAQALAQRLGARLIPVQHHHAHAAALLAEHGLRERILALACDGTGYGKDGAIWGGELLLAAPDRFSRLAHLRPLQLPGGDAAARDTRRCALALLQQAYGNDFPELPAVRRLLPDIPERRVLCAMLRHGVNSAKSSGLGRVFDGVASLLGLCAFNSFEAQAALSLESAAANAGVVACTPSGFELFSAGSPEVIDLAPTIRTIVYRFERGEDPAPLAALFHEQLAQHLAAAVLYAAKRTGITIIGLTGGVFCNQVLTRRLTDLLTRQGMNVLRHAVVPPADGGIALGQALVAGALAQGGQPCA